MSADRDIEFLRGLGTLRCRNAERAVALLWWHTAMDSGVEKSARELAERIAAAGYPKQNVSRLRAALLKDTRTAKGSSDSFRLRVTARHQLDEKYSAYSDIRPVQRSNAVLPLELFVGSRDYIERVVLQLNASYDNSLFDCCAVMCRRLLETLIIEVYEAHGRAGELKGADGNFMMFAGLLSHIEKDRKFNVGRSALHGLRDFKRLGDLSAHNRRFNARKDDIDRIRNGLRVAAEELLQLAGISRS